MLSTEFSQRCSRIWGWPTIKRKLKSITRLNSFLYFFALETGCRMIALFEALYSVMQICSLYHLVQQSKPSVLLPDPFWITKIELNGEVNRLFLYHTNHRFCMALCLVTVLNSMLLYIGTKWGHKVCLFLWIYISVFTTLMSNTNNTLRNFTLMQCLFLFPSLTLETYFAVIVASLICKYNEKPKECKSGFEVLSSDSEDL
ncbi:uncharacterized protein [Drosophila takahashii]|uniref:uncharacterized protein n=1 Tax=Drosophila takahashii TaxID=29030 RepID=UPI001CF91F84|nr:uncharacterized protein LOC108054375 [Drosophila takahashii]